MMTQVKLQEARREAAQLLRREMGRPGAFTPYGLRRCQVVCNLLETGKEDKVRCALDYYISTMTRYGEDDTAKEVLKEVKEIINKAYE